VKKAFGRVSRVDNNVTADHMLFFVIQVSCAEYFGNYNLVPSHLSEQFRFILTLLYLEIPNYWLGYTE